MAEFSRRALLQAALAAVSGTALWKSEAKVPALMLAKVYRTGSIAPDALPGYWISEKYNGVRGFWDGTQLWTRGGQSVSATA